MSVLVPLYVAQFTATEGAVAKFKATSVYQRTIEDPQNERSQITAFLA
jgi:hypothetical protein